jgi:hypothetical protein
MASKVDICNMALANVGHDAQIAELTDASRAAEQCRLHYDAALRSVLVANDWGFARKTAELSQRAPDAPDRWQYRYAIPGDCVAPRLLDDGLRVRQREHVVPFEVEGADILADLVPASLVYTSLANVPGLYPQHFVDALAWELASRLAMPLTKNPKIKESVRGMAHFELLAAIGQDRMLGIVDLAPDSTVVTGR